MDHLRTPFEELEWTRVRTFIASGNVAFLRAPPSDQARETLNGYRTDEDLHVHHREVFWQCQGRISESAFSSALLEKALGTDATMRNSTAVRKLAANYAPSGSDPGVTELREQHREIAALVADVRRLVDTCGSPAH